MFTLIRRNQIHNGVNLFEANKDVSESKSDEMRSDGLNMVEMTKCSEGNKNLLRFDLVYSAIHFEDRETKSSMDNERAYYDFLQWNNSLIVERKLK
jgi:hypothetical protein